MKKYFLFSAAILLSLFFVLAAIVRCLNFDESLAVKSGWLLLNHIPSSPILYMPTIIFFGWLSERIADPGALFLVARLLVAVLVLANLFWALSTTGFPLSLQLLAVIITLVNGSFIAHGFEFRYDVAILVGWLTAFGLMLRGRSLDYFWIGLVASWLMFHHLKGVYFACWLYVFTLLRVWFQSEKKLLRLTLFHLSFALSAAAWLAWSFFNGFHNHISMMYTQFFHLAVGSKKIWPWDALAEALGKDIFWWSLAFLSILLIVIGKKTNKSGPLLWASLFALVPLSFLFLHPHPWPYMLAISVPFCSVLMAAAFSDFFLNATRSKNVMLICCCLLVVGFSRHPFWDSYAKALNASRSQQVTVLRYLKQFAHPDDKVIDPSGLVYFLRPHETEWYTDTLFREKMLKGRWMNYPKTFDPQKVPWVLFTYRINWLPEQVIHSIHHDYILIGGCLGLYKYDERSRHIISGANLPKKEIASYR